MALVGQKAPDFTAQAVLPDDSIQNDFTLSSLRGRYVLLVFYPFDFTFVCPTELLALNDRLEDFRARNVEVIGVSIDSPYTHVAWRNTPAEEGGIGKIGYPLVADVKRTIAAAYGVLSQEAGAALRGTFLIDRDGIVRHETVNDFGLGRNIAEALRMVDALRRHEEKGDVCPANWTSGEESIQPTRKSVASYLSLRTRGKAKQPSAK